LARQRERAALEIGQRACAVEDGSQPASPAARRWRRCWGSLFNKGDFGGTSMGDFWPTRTRGQGQLAGGGWAWVLCDLKLLLETGKRLAD
jgi:hypothetical protein